MRRRFRYDPALGAMVEIVDQGPADIHYVQDDLAPYRNVIDGNMVEGRRQHEEFLRRNGVQVYEGSTTPQVTRKKADPKARRERIWEEVDRALQRGKNYRGDHPHNREE